MNVHCEGCGNELWISRTDETVCPCGVRHTFVPATPPSA